MRVREGGSTVLIGPLMSALEDLTQNCLLPEVFDLLF